MPSEVVIVNCSSYDSDEVSAAVARGLGLLGGIGRFASSGETILLKPNLLVASPPDAAVTTHPAVFEAVAMQFQAAGAILTYGDSPGFGRTEPVARKCGIADVADRIGIECRDFARGRDVPFPEGQLIHNWYFANGALEADGIVSLPKMKTHGLTRMTCAVKNPFGCVPGMRKGEFHARMKDEVRFAQMLVDMNRALGVRLHICDAVVAMEGNGPRNGDPRSVGALLLSTDPVALDAVVCRMMDLDVSLVGTCTYGELLGLGSATDIELLGDPIDPFIDPDYVVNRSRVSTTGEAGGRVSRFMRRWMVPKPNIVRGSCTRCGTCVKVCPVDPPAVDWESDDAEPPHSNPPVYEYDKCIRCYCCQEMCPERAIEIKVPILGRLLNR